MHEKLSVFVENEITDHMKFLYSRNSYRWLYMTLSRILSILEGKNIGRQLEYLSSDSFLKMEMNLLDFKIKGKTTSEKERLNSSDNWFEIFLLSNFKIVDGILLGLTAF